MNRKRGYQNNQYYGGDYSGGYGGEGYGGYGGDNYGGYGSSGFGGADDYVDRSAGYGNGGGFGSGFGGSNRFASALRESAYDGYGGNKFGDGSYGKPSGYAGKEKNGGMASYDFTSDNPPAQKRPAVDYSTDVGFGDKSSILPLMKKSKTVDISEDRLIELLAAEKRLRSVHDNSELDQIGRRNRMLAPERPGMGMGMSRRQNYGGAYDMPRYDEFGFGNYRSEFGGSYGRGNFGGTPSLSGRGWGRGRSEPRGAGAGGRRGARGAGGRGGARGAGAGGRGGSGAAGRGGARGRGGKSTIPTVPAEKMSRQQLCGVLQEIQNKLKRAPTMFSNACDFHNLCIQYNIHLGKVFIPDAEITGFHCEIYIANNFLAEGKAESKTRNNARDVAINEAVMKLKDTPVNSVLDSSKVLDMKALKERNVENADSANFCKESNLAALILNGNVDQAPKEHTDFVILKPKNVIVGDGMEDAAILRQSADFSKMRLEYYYFKENNQQKCEIYLEKKLLAKSLGIHNKVAKGSASNDAMNQMRKKCYMLETRKINKDEVEAAIKEAKDDLRTNLSQYQYDDNFIRPKIMDSLSGNSKEWIVITRADIYPKETINGTDEGPKDDVYLSETAKARGKIIFDKYEQSKNFDNLIITHEFSKAEKHDLKSMAFEQNRQEEHKITGTNNHVTLCRKRLTALELVEHVKECGPPGSHIRYQVTPPKA